MSAFEFMWLFSLAPVFVLILLRRPALCVDGTATFHQDFFRTWPILGEFIWFTEMVGLQNKTTQVER